MRIAKAVAAALGAVATVATAALADDVLDMSETGKLIATLIEAALTVWAVYQVPNRPPGEPDVPTP